MASSDLNYIKGDLHHLSDLSIVLLGCRNSGKRSAGNIILGQNEFDLQEREQCLKRHGEVAGRKITVVEAPGWYSDGPVAESTELLKEEILGSMSMCPPGPLAVLVEVNVDRIFTEKEREILTGYLNLLGDKVWSHLLVLFTFGDSLGDTTIEQYIENEGEDLQWMVMKCENRYHVLKNKMDDDSQVMELLEKIEKMVEENQGCHLELDMKILPIVEESRRKEQEKSMERRMNGRKYFPCFMNVCIYFVKLLQVFCFSSELELLPLWAITHLPRFRVGFGWVHQFPSTSKKHAEGFREDQGTKKGSQSTSTLHLDTGHASVDAELFTPELVKNRPKDRNRDEYRFLCPRAGRFKCKLTDLVFEMEGKGEVLYRVMSWDSHALNGLRQMEPAGPLYGIQYLEGSIRQLHVPHCEIHWGKDVIKLTVADVTDGNVEIIQPLNVTDTHVIVDGQRLCVVGLLKSLLFQTYPIRAQVLLFRKETGKHRMSKLRIHLVPGNVPVEEVQKQHNCNTYIENFECELTPGKIYRLRCNITDHDYVSQPEDKTFDCEYGPNDHPMFEVLFNTEVDKFTLSLLDENGKEVWRPHMALLTVRETASPKMDGTGADLDVDEMLSQIVSTLLLTGDRIEAPLKRPTYSPVLECNPDTHVQKGFLQSFKSPSTYQEQSTEDMELFAPELVENCAKDRNRCEYRFLCPHAGHFMCKLTNLVFEMEGKGEVLYRIVSWDSHLLDGINHKEPAGPLYSIDCLEGSILYLHLPHCETRTDVVELSVAHVTGGNVEIIQPLKVTNTHAIIQIRGLSLFGFLKALLFQAYPIRAQVLLFYKEITGKQRKSKLHIHLLPANVPVEEVQKRECNMNIKTSSKCQLTPGRKYSPCCKTNDYDYVPQPEDETFDCDYGPNYHPTFEVVFRSEVDEVTLSLLDENGLKVWKPRQVLLTGTEEAATQMDAQIGADFVDKHKETLIQNVPSVMEIADRLEGRKMITNEMYRKIQAEATPHDKMRALYEHLGGRAAKAEFYTILKEKQPYLVMELESGSGQA